MPPNRGYPLRLPHRMFGADTCRRVYYSSKELGPLGFLLRHGRKGRVPLPWRNHAEVLRQVFDHAEHWVAMREGSGADAPRILVGHPYRFTNPMLYSIEKMSQECELIWSIVPPIRGAFARPLGPGQVGSWYSDSAFLITMQLETAFVGAPAPEELLTAGAVRAPLEPGQYEASLPPEARRRKRYKGVKLNPEKVFQLPKNMPTRVPSKPLPPLQNVSIFDMVTHSDEYKTYARMYAAQQQQAREKHRQGLLDRAGEALSVFVGPDGVVDTSQPGAIEAWEAYAALEKKS